MTVASRPDLLVLVLGTGTEVGKTWVAAGLLRHLRAQGATVAARKPAQSFDPGDPQPRDADVLAAATGEPPAAVCPEHRWYPVAMAPPMAADALGLATVRLADLLTEITWSAGTDVGLVEGAGGVRSPIAHDADHVDLARSLRPDHVVLVADAGLGTINGVRSGLDALAVVAAPVTVVLNRFDETDDLHMRNAQWLAAEGVEVVTTVEDLATRLGH